MKRDWKRDVKAVVKRVLIIALEKAFEKLLEKAWEEICELLDCGEAAFVATLVLVSGSQDGGKNFIFCRPTLGNVVEQLVDLVLDSDKAPELARACNKKMEFFELLDVKLTGREWKRTKVATQSVLVRKPTPGVPRIRDRDRDRDRDATFVLRVNAKAGKPIVETWKNGRLTASLSA